MSRRSSPRCSRKFGVVFAAALLAAPLAAAAEREDLAGRSRASSAQTLIGAPNAMACSQAAAAGRIDAESVAACDQALRTERLNKANTILTLNNRGAIHLRRNEAALALADFDAALERDPRNAEAHLNRGAALVMAGQHGQAVSAITTALGLGVKAPHKAYFNRGAAREAMRDFRGAWEDYSTALQIEPDWGPAEAELARFVRARRDRLTQAAADGLISLEPPAPGQQTDQPPTGTP